MDSFVSSLELKEASKSKVKAFLSESDIDTALEVAYGLRTKAVSVRQLSSLEKNKDNVFAMPTLEEVKKKTESIYIDSVSSEYIFTEGISTCSNCSGSNVWFKMVQIRGGDEAETGFYICANPSCSNTWKVG